MIKKLSLYLLVVSFIGLIAQAQAQTCTGTLTVTLTGSASGTALAAPTGTATQAFCQGSTVASLVATPVTGATIKWYDAASGGTLLTNSTVLATGNYYAAQILTSTSCESVLRFAVAVTVNPATVAPTVTTPVVYCLGATPAALTATGTALLWYTAATGGTGSATAPTPSTATAGNTSYFVSQTVTTNGVACEGPRAEIVVTVNPATVAPTVTTPVIYCLGATPAALTAMGTALLWYTAATGGTGSATAPTPSTATAGNTSYFVSQTVTTNGVACEGPRAEIVVTVNPATVAPTVTTPVIYCLGATPAALTATGTALLWYTAATGGTGSATAPTPSTATAGNTSYFVSQTITTNGVACEGPRAEIVVTVNPATVAPTVTTPVVYCLGATPAALTATGTALLWYTAATGGTGSATAPTPSTATAGNTSYFVSQTVTTNGVACEGPRAEIVVTVNPATVAPTVTTPVIYCLGATPAALTATGTALLWYTAATGGTGSATAPTPSTATAGNTSYFVSQTVTTNGVACEGPRAEIVVTVNPATVAPTVTTPVIYCLGATPAALTATGTALLWYTAATGGTGSATAPTPSTATAGNTSYFVSQTVTTNGVACEGPRAVIVVTVNPATVAPTVTTPVIYCLGATPAALTATGTALLWYTAATGGTGSATAPTPSTATAGNTSYFVSQTVTINGVACEGPRAEIVVTVNPAAAAPTVTTPVAYCQGITATALTATGTALLWYTAATGGTGSATAPTPSTATVGNTSYFVSQTVTTNGVACESPRAEIVVTVNPLPTAGSCTVANDACQLSAGQIRIEVSGGTTPYTLTATGKAVAPNPSAPTVSPVTPPAGVVSGSITSYLFNGLAGNVEYKFKVTDNKGCIVGETH